MSFVASQGGTSKKENTEKDIRKKSHDILFLEKQVFHFHLLSVRDLLGLVPPWKSEVMTWQQATE